jgi:hypothetical protein
MARTYDSHAITTALGLPRPFDSYAPRTQRRYLKAYREGQSRSEALSRERRNRAQQPAERAYKAARDIRKMGLNAQGSHDPDNIQRLGEAVGWEAAAERLEDQRDAVRNYKDGRPRKGHADWDHMGGMETDAFIDLAPYYFYHPNVA